MNHPDPADTWVGCPRPSVLVEFAESLLAPGKRREIGIHVSDCDRCRREIEEIEALTDLIIARCREHPRVSGADVLPRLVERIEGALERIVTIPLVPRLSRVGRGVRGPIVSGRAVGAGRSMISEGGGWWVQVRIESDPATGRATLRGRVVASESARAPADFEEIRVVILAGSRIVESAAADRFGRFRIRIDAGELPDVDTLRLWTSRDTELVMGLSGADDPEENPV